MAGREEPLEAFERAFAEYYRVPYVLATSSGSAALLAALLAVDVPRRRPVLAPAYSWPQVAAVPRALGYRVVFVDDDGHGRLDTLDLGRRLAGGVAAVIVCHLWGNPSPMRAVWRLAAEYGVPVIEDCSQALGSHSGGRRVGTWGAFGYCSTGRGKPLSTGEGGLLWTAHPALHRRAYALTQHTQRRAPQALQEATLFDSLSLRMHPLAARGGMRALAGLTERLTRRSAAVEAVRAALRLLPEARTPEVLVGDKAMWSHCPVLLPRRLAARLQPYLATQQPAYLLASGRRFAAARRLARHVRYVAMDGGDDELPRLVAQLARARADAE